jgi:hypothetical protein
VIADLQRPYNGIGLTQVSGVSRKCFEGLGKVVFPNGEFPKLTTRAILENIVSKEVFEDRNSFILGRSQPQVANCRTERIHPESRWVPLVCDLIYRGKHHLK